MLRLAKVRLRFLEERKRGRPRLELPQESRKAVKPPSAKSTNVCASSDCWSQTLSSSIVPGPSTSPSTGLSFEQAKSVEIFFDLYKHHASKASCCKAWFSRQLNKICGMLKTANSVGALLAVIEWMNKHQILITSSPLPPDQRAFVDPDSGFHLPPMFGSKGPMFADNNIAMVTSREEESDLPKSENVAFISLEFSRDETCKVQTSGKFDHLFGKDAFYCAKILDNVYGGLLPWGADIFAAIFHKPFDVVLLIRMLAFRFQSLPRMTDSTPINRRVQSSHIFTCIDKSGRLLDCVVRFDHVEKLSFEGVEVSVLAIFEPYTSSLTETVNEVKSDELSSLKKVKVESEDDKQLFGELTSGSDDAYSSEKVSGGEYQEEWVQDLLRWVEEEESNDES